MVDCLWRQVDVSILVETKRQGKDQGLNNLTRSQLLPNNDYEEKGRTLVFVICNRRGESIRATSEVENSISNRAMSPCFISKHFEKGSVVYMRKPLEVPSESY